MPLFEETVGRTAHGKRTKRMIAILDLLSVRGDVEIGEFADHLNVSAATIRRDLTDLEEQKLLIRTHGGAIAIDSGAELPVALRDSQHREAKQLIAEAAAAMIPSERQAIALSGGSTAAFVARALSNHAALTIVTNSLTVAGLVTASPQLKILMTGGLLRPRSLELVGALAENTFTAVNIATAVLGTDGISAAGGVTTHDETEARTNNAMVRAAQRTIVVTDGSKVGKLAMAKVADLSEIQMLITDPSADSAELARISEAGVRVHVVSPHERS